MIEGIKPERLKELGLSLKDAIEAGLNQKGGMETWLAAVENFHRNGPPEKPSKNLPAVHVPILQPRADALAAQICNVVGSQDPYMLAVRGALDTDVDPDQDTQKDRLESAIHRVWQDAEFEHHIREEAPIAIDSNACIVKVCPSGEAYSKYDEREGIRFKTVHPTDFVIYPATRDGIPAAQVVGDRFYKPVWQIKQMMLAGDYYNADTLPESDPDEHDETGRFARANTALGLSSDQKDSASVELWDVLWTTDAEVEGIYREYRVTVVYHTGFILDIEEYPYAEKWYFRRYLKPDSAQFWSSVSVGRDLAPINDAYNKLSSSLYAGSMTTAKPPMIGPKLEEKYSSWEPGDYINSDDPAQPYTPNIRFDGGYIVQQLANYEKQADLVARINQSSMGSPTPTKQTATAESIQAAGVASGIEEYISNFGRDLPRMAKLTQDIVLKNYQAVQEYYGGEFPATEMDLERRITWEQNGKNPGNTPGAKMQAAQMFMEFSVNPATGLDPYEIVRIMRSNSPLGNTDNIQKSKEAMLQEALDAQLNAALDPAMAGAAGNPLDALMGAGTGAVGPEQMLAVESNPAPGPDFSDAGSLPIGI